MVEGISNSRAVATAVRAVAIAVGAVAGALLLLIGFLYQQTGTPFTLQLFGDDKQSPSSGGDTAWIWSTVVLGLFLPLLMVGVGGATSGRRRSARRWAADVLVSGGVAAAAMIIVSFGTSWLEQFLPASLYRGNAGGQFRAEPPVSQWGSAASAGILEEFSYLAFPVLVWLLLPSCIRVFRNGRDVSWAGTWRRRGVWVVLAVCVLLRFNLHTYQGVAPALAAVVWSGVNVALYLRFRSLLGLVAAHAFFDGAVVGTVGLGTEWVSFSILFWVSAAVVVVSAAFAMTDRGRRWKAPAWAGLL